MSKLTHFHCNYNNNADSNWWKFIEKYLQVFQWMLKKEIHFTSCVPLQLRNAKYPNENVPVCFLYCNHRFFQFGSKKGNNIFKLVRISVPFECHNLRVWVCVSACECECECACAFNIKRLFSYIQCALHILAGSAVNIVLHLFEENERLRSTPSRECVWMKRNRNILTDLK